MDSNQEDRYGMYLKVDLFLVSNAADLAFNPAIATTRTSLNSLISLIAQSDSTATRDISGYTLAKNQHRSDQIALFKIVRAGMMGYYTTNPDIKSKTIIDYTDSVIDKFRDSELYMKTDQLLDLALPVKLLLAPFGVSDAQVDSLNTLNAAWQALEPIGRQEEGINKAAGEDVDRYQGQVFDLLNNTLDSYLKVVNYNNPNLYSQYQTARMIDDSGGSSGTEGYDITTVTLPAGGSIIVPVGAGSLNPEEQFYFRAISGSVIICTTDLPANPCADGYRLVQGVTFKDKLSALGIDLNKSNIQLTNPGLTEAVVRAGGKED